MFQFKQFSVDQSNCAMKINTDGVLLGALAEGDNPACVLDIGTGTGVIALMLAQRFSDAQIDAVEIDAIAAATAEANFKNSVFEGRLSVYPIGFEIFFETRPEKRYDLIVSNPPFYINSLQSPEEKKQLAKHADQNFFEDMLRLVARHLSARGACWLILPLQTAAMIKTIAADVGLSVRRVIQVKSFADKEPHREIVAFGFEDHQKQEDQLVIYKSVGVYTHQYQQALKEFFTIF